MKRIFLAVFISNMLIGENVFDLKIYERSLKKYIPWSLTGTARDLRSDAKDYLQKILRSFVLLRPDASWQDRQKPSSAVITDGFKGLKDYLAKEGNEAKRQWVADSIAYIVNTYMPEVEKQLDSANSAALPGDLAGLIDAKKELFKEFSQKIKAEQTDFLANSVKTTV